MGEKEKLEKWLDDMIEVHRDLWRNGRFDDKTYYDRTPDTIFLKGVDHVAYILGCSVEYSPVDLCGKTFGVKACVKYKGVDFTEYVYD